jgi:hypothetical protein
LPLIDNDGNKYQFIAEIDSDPEENNFSVKGACLTGDLNVHRLQTSAIIYSNARGVVYMSCQNEDWEQKDFHINSTTMLKIQEWFTQFNRNCDDSSWMPQCETLGGYKLYCGHLYGAQGSDQTTGKKQVCWIM